MTKTVSKLRLWTGWFIPLALIMIAIGVSVWTYPALPNRLATYSDVDWATRKEFIVTLIPVIMLFIFTLFRLAPFIGRKYMDIQRLKSMLNALLVFMMLLLLVLHTVILLQPLNYQVPFRVPTIVSIVIAIYFIMIGNYLPHIQRSKLPKEPAHSKGNLQEVFISVIKMKLLGLNFLADLYLLGLGSNNDNPRLQKQLRSFASRILIFGGMIIGLTAFLPGNYPIVGMIVVVVAVAITSIIVVARLKKTYKAIN
ncbi:hypothetical protein H1230_12595 [Paenibacillus sp. 19GGS1-52]|uniref:hypothetical protein n=1 Tax=Paenibacillus sp. 19GGS1-52 TaxID=2758563 RepID=UPI001EFA49AE|nr:hypothetical protein [Paenibacillus sp. 19GGS1-52]ULO09530.1 hypothetical protein H1230_12595 [Paenibacillus sp. 19GGS1-52]